MGALVQTKASRFAPFTAIETQFKPIEARSESPVRSVRAGPVPELHAFPEASTAPALPMSIRDEMLEFYAFVFFQGGFRQLAMTFEQFLLVAAAIKPFDFTATREKGRTL